MSESSTAGIVIGLIGALVLMLLLPLIVVLAAGDDQEPSALPCRPASAAGDNGAPEDASGGDEAEQASTRENVPEEYWEAVETAADTSGLSTEVLAAQIDQESGWNPDATSPVGAQGIAQFMPETAAQYDLDPTDPLASIEAQGQHMADLQEDVAGLASDERELIELSLAAYNAGPGAVQEHDGIPPYAETQDYVSSILSSAQGNYSADCAPPGGHTAEVADLGPGEWTHPLPGGTVTSGFGSRPCPISYALNCEDGVSDHRGIDIATAPPGSTVLAPMDLEIRDVGTQPGTGETVLGAMTEEPYLHVEFGHCRANSFHVEAGQTVEAGTPLCDEGTTGNSEAIHLHLQFGTPEGEWDQAGWENLIDPEPFLKEKGIL